MSKNYQKAAECLNLFVADTEGESLGAVTHELRAAGVNVEGFVTDVKRIAGVRSGFSRVGRFANKTREEILKLLEECQTGLTSGLAQSGLAAREGELDQLSDEQLQKLLEKLESERPTDSKK